MIFFFLLTAPGLASASGIGKFLQVPDTTDRKKERRECEPSPPPGGELYRLRMSAMLGYSDFPPAENNDGTSLYLDAGYRPWVGSGGCLTKGKSGLFRGGRDWWVSSLSLGLKSELVFRDPSQSSIGFMVGWDSIQQSNSFLSEIFNLIPIGVGVNAGPYWRSGQPGVYGAFELRAFVAFRAAANYEFGRGLGWSAHIGIIDPHILVKQILDWD
jgi:hypothetical protein